MASDARSAPCRIMTLFALVALSRARRVRALAVRPLPDEAGAAARAGAAEMTLAQLRAAAGRQCSSSTACRTAYAGLARVRAGARRRSPSSSSIAISSNRIQPPDWREVRYPAALAFRLRRYSGAALRPEACAGADARAAPAAALLVCISISPAMGRAAGLERRRRLLYRRALCGADGRATAQSVRAWRRGRSAAAGASSWLRADLVGARPCVARRSMLRITCQRWPVAAAVAAVDE